MVALGALAIFVLAALGVLVGTLQGLRHAGMALNPRRPMAQRRVRALLAVLFGLAMLASAAAGYLGIVVLMYYAVAQGS